MKRAADRYSIVLKPLDPGVRKAEVHRTDGGLAALFACVEGEESDIIEALRERFEGPRLRVVKGGAT